jgi:hypothetical protein
VAVIPPPHQPEKTMNHIELIKSTLEEILKNHPQVFGSAVNGTKELQKFLDYIKDFEKAGYKITAKKDIITQGKGHTYERKIDVLKINMKKDGVSANKTIQLDGGWFSQSFTFRAITPNGSYAQIEPEESIRGSRQNFPTTSSTVIAELEKQPKSKEEAQKRLKQNMSDYTHDFKFEHNTTVRSDEGIWVTCNIQIESLNLLGIVTIAEDGKISEAIYTPDAEVWFEFSCRAPTGATFNILSNGEKFIPITRYGKQKLSTDMSPKDSVHLERMSKHDQELIQIAIKMYLESL